MTWVVVGASSGLGRSLSTELAVRGGALLLVSSDARDLSALCADLELRFSCRARYMESDGRDPAGMADALAEALGEAARIDGILLPIGMIDDGDDGALPPDRAAAIVNVNFLAVSAVVSRLLPRLASQRSGSLVGFGSVAALRGRSRNVVYSAAKRALQGYFESLRHACEPKGLAVAFYVLGYMDTSMAYGRRLAIPKANPDAVAAHVCDHLGRHRGVHYVPRFWGPISLVVRNMPWALFRRLSF